MKLWHGTSAGHLERILSRGIEPRHERRSLWDAASRSDAVYLTDAYALHFAGHAAAEGEGLAIVEIDVDLLPDGSALVADEDALWGLWKAGRVEPGPEDDTALRAMTLEEQASFFARRLPQWRDAGFGHSESLRAIGNCAHIGTVPASAISRAVEFPPDGPWRFRWLDPVVSVTAFQWCGPECRAAQLVFAGRTAEARAVRDRFGQPFPADEMEAEIAPLRKVVHDAADLHANPCGNPLPGAAR